MNTDHIQIYFDAIRQADPAEISEHSLRTPFETLLNALAPAHATIRHEGKRTAAHGIPDFTVFAPEGNIGYIETKKVGADLRQTAQSEQLQRYQQLNDNILITDYCTFFWLKNGGIAAQCQFCSTYDMGNRHAALQPHAADELIALLKSFFDAPPQGIATANDLAKALAARTRFLKISLDELLGEQLENQNNVGVLRGLFQSIQKVINPNIQTSEFCDAFAQTLSYGLFLAKLNAERNFNGKNDPITYSNAHSFLPDSFALIRELLGFTSAVEREYGKTKKNVEWVLGELLLIINNLDVITLQKSLSFNKHQNKNTNKEGDPTYADPYLYFYEDFLGQYDSSLRKAKGVYYRPPQVVRFIVRAIDEVLQQNFGIAQGLADQNQVNVLDFATGTGTFLLEIIKQILDNANPTGVYKYSETVKNHILQNLYGFEYLMAPYTVAHLKLSQFLKDNGYELKPSEQLKIYLTDTLTPFSKQTETFMPALSTEGLAAQNVKEKPVLVICGNPPYSISSKNISPQIQDDIKLYKQGLGERKINLDDDYIKFIRFAHKKIVIAKQGVLALITNNSYLDGATHRRMRETIYQDFDTIYIINLHGNSIKKEGDENVFDIRVGTAILIAVKNPLPAVKKQVFYFSTLDNQLIKRKQKFEFCDKNTLQTADFAVLTPTAPNFWFVTKNLKNYEHYQKFWSIKDIFGVYSTGIGTKVDKIATDPDPKALSKRIKDILTTKYRLPELIMMFGLGKNTTWEHAKAIKATFDPTKITIYDYRPFSTRYVYYDKDFLSRSRSEVMDNFFEKENIGLECGRFEFIAFVSDRISDEHFGGGKSYKFPLYTYGSAAINGNGYLFDDGDKKDNFSPAFRKFIKQKYGNKTAVMPAPQPDNSAAIIKLQAEISQFQNQLITFETMLQESIINGTNGIAELEILANKRRNQIQARQQELEALQPPSISPKAGELSGATEPEPHQVFYYMYAVLHSPRYRYEYTDFLKMDFPRIPFVDDLAAFYRLSGIGKELIDAHLLRRHTQGGVGVPHGEGNHEINEIKYIDNRLYYNATQYFDGVSAEVWAFCVGGYGVLPKYLKDRKNDILQPHDLNHLQNTIQAIAFTLDKMQEIDTITDFADAE